MCVWSFYAADRAIRRARADFTALDAAARTFSASPDEVPVLVATRAEKLKDADKFRRKLEIRTGRTSRTDALREDRSEWAGFEGSLASAPARSISG